MLNPAPILSTSSTENNPSPPERLWAVDGHPFRWEPHGQGTEPCALLKKFPPPTGPIHAADKRIEEEAEGHLEQLKGPFQAPWIIWVTRLISPRLR